MCKSYRKLPNGKSKTQPILGIEPKTSCTAAALATTIGVNSRKSFPFQRKLFEKINKTIKIYLL